MSNSEKFATVNKGFYLHTPGQGPHCLGPGYATALESRYMLVCLSYFCFIVSFAYMLNQQRGRGPVSHPQRVAPGLTIAAAKSHAKGGRATAAAGPCHGGGTPSAKSVLRKVSIGDLRWGLGRLRPCCLSMEAGQRPMLCCGLG
jgi:hypothetical protein